MAKTTDDGFTTRTLMALANDMAERAVLDERIRTQFEALLKEHGIKIAEPTRKPARRLNLGPGVGRNTTINPPKRRDEAD